MQNEIYVYETKRVAIEWRVYYQDDGKIIACSPTRIPELSDVLSTQIDPQLGNAIIAGKVKVDSYRVLSVNGSLHVVEVQQDQINREIVDQNKGIRFHQLLLTKQTERISVCWMPDEHQLLLQCNPLYGEDLLSEIAAGSIPPSVRFYFVKQNDPSWLFSWYDLNLTDLITQNYLLVDFELPMVFSVLVDRLIPGLTLLQVIDNQIFLNFHEFRKDILTKLHTQEDHQTEPFVNMWVENSQLHFSLNFAYRSLLESYLIEKDARSELLVHVSHSITPFLISQVLKLNLQTLLYEVVRFPTKIDDPYFRFNMNHWKRYFRLESRSKRFKQMILAMEHKEPELLEVTPNSPILRVTLQGTKCSVSLVTEYKRHLQSYLRLNPKGKKFTILVLGKQLVPKKLNIKDLLHEDISWSTEFAGTAIYIDVSDPQAYFRLQQKKVNR